MTDARRKIGRDLLRLNGTCASHGEIAAWAHAVYLDSRGLDKGTIDDLMTLVAMAEGPEFHLTRGEMQALGRRLAAA